MMQMFRKLSEEEEASFTAWAKERYAAASPLAPLNGNWHPVVRYTMYSLLEEQARELRVAAQAEVEALIEGTTEEEYDPTIDADSEIPGLLSEEE